MEVSRLKEEHAKIMIQRRFADFLLFYYDLFRLFSIPLGVLPAAINASTLALLDAGIAMQDFVASVSCGIHSTSAMLDLSNAEEMDLPHLTVAVLPRTKQVTLASLETRLHVERFEQIFTLAIDAAAVLHNEMELAVRDRTKTLVQAMTGKTVEAANVMSDEEEDGEGDGRDNMML